MRSEGEDFDPIEQTIERHIRAEVLEIRTTTPGQVVKYDPASCSATIQPAIQTLGAGEGAIPESLEAVAHVPVLQLGGGGFYLCFPLQAGDPVLLTVSDRSLSRWKAGDGSPVDPGIAITHSIGDAIAIPGLAPLKHAPENADPADLVLGAVDQKAELRMQLAGQTTLTGDSKVELNAGATGKIRIGNEAAELLSLVDDLIGLLQTAMVATAMGPQPLTNILPQLATLKGKLALLKE